MSYTTIIDANDKRLKLGIRELFQYRDLFWILAYRDYRIRYAQTFLGFGWAFLQPFITLVIFILVFGKAAKVDTGTVPYPVFAIVGQSAWTYFAFVMSQSGGSIIGAQNMVKKIYFPRLIIPLSKAVVGFVDYGIAFLMMIILMVYYQFVPNTQIIFLPIFILLTIISALAVGIWLSTLTIRYRDFKHIIPFMVQFGLYASPVGYPAELVIKNAPDWVSYLYFLNPMAGIIEGYRWCILGAAPPGILSYISFSVVIVLFISGLFYFKRVERIMADIV